MTTAYFLNGTQKTQLYKGPLFSDEMSKNTLNSWI